MDTAMSRAEQETERKMTQKGLLRGHGVTGVPARPRISLFRNNYALVQRIRKDRTESRVEETQKS